MPILSQPSKTKTESLDSSMNTHTTKKLDDRNPKKYPRNLLKIGNVTSNFVKTPKALLNNPDINPAAILCFGVIQGLPENWNISEAGLAKIIPQCGRHAIKKGLSSLAANGYLVKSRMRNPDNLLGHSYWFLISEPCYRDEYIEILKQHGFVPSSKHSCKCAQKALSKTKREEFENQICLFKTNAHKLCSSNTQNRQDRNSAMSDNVLF